VCGVFGNISDADIRHDPNLAVTGAAGRDRGSGRATASRLDVTVDIREWFVDAGFTSRARRTLGGSSSAWAEPSPAPEPSAGVKMFDFNTRTATSLRTRMGPTTVRR
jgi:hypothetical protein